MVEADEVQGNVLRAHGGDFTCARYLLFRIRDHASARETVRAWMRMASFGAPAKNGPNVRIGIAFTYRGLKVLGIREDLLGAFPDDFRHGPRLRARENGDRPRKDWQPGLGRGHVLLTIHAHDRSARDERAREILKGINGSIAKVHDLKAEVLGTEQANGANSDDPGSCSAQNHREHFGFADGCSQPAVEGVDDDPTGDGVYARRAVWNWPPLRRLRLLAEDLGITQVPRRWRPIRAGEFILGYEDEEGRLPEGPSGALGRNGTFMVYRVIQQHPDVLHKYLAEQATNVKQQVPELGLGENEEAKTVLKAKIVGRWPDGTPLALSPERSDTEIARDRRRANDFLYREPRDGYRDDPHGFACPLGAHVRRVNPRDALPGGGERAMGHRIIRRGMPYRWRDDKPEDGLAFVCFGASIRDGFEFIQRRWINGGEAFGLGGERDLLLQQGETGTLTGMVIPRRDGRTVVLKPPPEPFTTVRGCEYLFVPSRTACEWLARL